jgi:hypothetical protein
MLCGGWADAGKTPASHAASIPKHRAAVRFMEFY